MQNSPYHYGARTENDIVMTAVSLRAYAFGLIAFRRIKVLAPRFFARQNLNTPVTVGILAMAANMVFNLMLIWPLAHAGLALASALSAFLIAGMLGWLLHMQGVLVFQPGWGRYDIQLIEGCALMSAGLWWLTPEWLQWLEWSVWARVQWLALLVVAGAAVYFAWLAALGVRWWHFRLRG